MTIQGRFWRNSLLFDVGVIATAILCGSLLAFAATKRKHPPTKPIDLNSATMEQLEELPGIGPVTAKRIIEFREKSGPFRKVEDLLAIPRISKARLEKLRPYVKVSPPSYAHKK